MKRSIIAYGMAHPYAITHQSSNAPEDRVEGCTTVEPMGPSNLGFDALSSPQPMEGWPAQGH